MFDFYLALLISLIIYILFMILFTYFDYKKRKDRFSYSSYLDRKSYLDYYFIHFGNTLTYRKLVDIHNELCIKENQITDGD